MAKSRRAVRTCKFCGMDLNHFKEFCNEWCRSDFEDTKGCNDYHDLRDRELAEKFNN